MQQLNVIPRSRLCDELGISRSTIKRWIETRHFPRPIRPKTPFNTDCYVAFCKHELYPVYRVLLYHEIGLPSRQMEPSNKGKYLRFTGRRPRFAV